MIVNSNREILFCGVFRFIDVTAVFFSILMIIITDDETNIGKLFNDFY